MPEQRGVLLLFYDLPVRTAAQRRAYGRFTAFIKREGFMRLQESVYVKLLRHSVGTAGAAELLRGGAPPEGRVSVLPLSLRQFRGLTALCGESFSMCDFADELVCLI